ncbi:ankyrin repeat domain-containing protein [Cupriavidus sp. AU9028]|uniref:ankyrin repeat domain-containing protein n=1 Tax=Cupriavidus sp. AU9028 TaxID=2871157 RepID=UPI001C93D5FD|nr:ankyrin repeat domain-containing protein [Cupriavidus sp. AU9028]MBY4898228.1 ankyrin repeat domain-containing protein [Cupriavidus sp. AU9028]
MLSIANHNAFSARAGALHHNLSNSALEHHPRAAPLEDLERWICRRVQVLELQVSLLNQGLLGSVTPAQLQRAYRDGLSRLNQDLRTSFRETMQARILPDKPSYIIAEDGGSFVLLDRAEMERRVQRFGERLDEEMQVHGNFTFGPASGWQAMRADRHLELEQMEQVREEIKEKQNAINLPLVETGARIAEQMRQLHQERRDALRDAAFHQSWLAACERGDIAQMWDVLRHLGRRDALHEFIDRLGPNGMNALHIACQSHDIAIAAELLQAGASLTAANDMGRLPIHIAARAHHGRPERARTFLAWLEASGAEVGACDPSGRSALNEACYFGNQIAVEWLVGRGLRLDERDCHARTPLHVAAAGGHGHLIRWMLANGADADARNAAGERPIVEACLSGKPDGVQAFLDAGHWLTQAELEEMDRRGMLGSAVVRNACAVPLAAMMARLTPAPLPQPLTPLPPAVTDAIAQTAPQGGPAMVRMVERIAEPRSAAGPVISLRRWVAERWR